MYLKWKEQDGKKTKKWGEGWSCGGREQDEKILQGEVGTVTEVVITNEGITEQRSEETCNSTTKLMNE